MIRILAPDIPYPMTLHEEEKCGFKVEGVLRQEIFKDGERFDKIVLGLLREEYLSRRKLK
jgi:RimJ/RimL family protein N-acetyltransferase